VFVPIGDDNPLKRIRFQYVTVTLIVVNVLAYLLDDLQALGIHDMVFIVGHLREEMEDWIESEYPDKTRIGAERTN